jgi:hypothetical protein
MDAESTTGCWFPNKGCGLVANGNGCFFLHASKLAGEWVESETHHSVKAAFGAQPSARLDKSVEAV